MKKLDEIKIRISAQDKQKFREAAGRRGMSAVLQDFISRYIKEK